jgi:hypothetical protein
VDFSDQRRHLFFPFRAGQPPYLFLVFFQSRQQPRTRGYSFRAEFQVEHVNAVLPHADPDPWVNPAAVVLPHDIRLAVAGSLSRRLARFARVVVNGILAPTLPAFRVPLPLLPRRRIGFVHGNPAPLKQEQPGGLQTFGGRLPKFLFELFVVKFQYKAQLCSAA